MSNPTRIKLAISSLFLIILAAGFAIQAFGQDNPNSSSDRPSPTPIPKDTRDLSKYAIVEFADSPSVSDYEAERRRSISQRYDREGWVFKSVRPETGGVGRTQEIPPPPLFPFSESSLVIVGEVKDAVAFLSNDKRGVYTEFTVRPREILKDSTGTDVKDVVLDRAGGVVRYPNGQKVRYADTVYALPTTGAQYIFFLAKDEKSPNYYIITSYELAGSKVLQMETGYSFEDYKALDKRAFLDLLRQMSSTTP